MFTSRRKISLNILWNAIRPLAVLSLLCWAPLTGRAEEPLSVSKVARATHPAFRANNLWFGPKSPWNRDMTRILLFETKDPIPEYGETGRGLVWGYVEGCDVRDCVTEWTTLDEYKKFVKPVPDEMHMTKQVSAYWSIFPGEENVIYAPFYSGDNCSALKKINVDTGAISDVVSINDSGVDCKSFACYGWTDDEKLVCSMKYEDWTDGGYKIDVQARSKTFISRQPLAATSTCLMQPSYIDNEGWTWPDYFQHGHGGKNPGRTFWLNNYGRGTYPGAIDTKGVIRRSDCSVIPDQAGSDNHSTHVSWQASNDWFLTSTCGDDCNYREAPHLDTFRLYQATFNGHSFSYRELVAKQSAGRWETAPGKADYMNYQAIAIATLRKDGRQAIFMSTDGKYSYEDYQARKATPWGTEGIFLVDFRSSSEDPAPPGNLRVKAASSANGQ